MHHKLLARLHPEPVRESTALPRTCSWVWGRGPPGQGTDIKERACMIGERKGEDRRGRSEEDLQHSILALAALTTMIDVKFTA